MNEEIDFPLLIRLYRQGFGENQKSFGMRFGATANTVSRWESGEYEAPYKVLSVVLQSIKKPIKCSVCNGSGFIYK